MLMFNSSRLITNAIVSVVQTIISALVLFFLYRYLVSHLGVDQLGLWSVILASTSIARLGDMGLTGSVVKFVARYRALKENVQAADVVQTAAISIALVMAVLVLVFYPLLDDVLLFVVPKTSMAQVLSILPWAVLSLWLGSVGGVFQSSLDGCQRMDIRNILMIVNNVLYFIAALWLVPHYGLVGLAIGQAVQALLLVLMSWFALRYQLVSLPWIPIYWSKEKFIEMFSYAVNFQINSIAILFFEPVTKLLMTRYAGLSGTAFYEMANQLITKLRELLIAANQTLVPIIAHLHERNPEIVYNLYSKTYRIVFFIAVPFYAAILIVLPMISLLWIGKIEAQFLLFGVLLVIGWGLNTLVGPAYFINLGTGNLKWNSISHVSMAIFNVLFGLIFGTMFGGLGVVIGAMISLVVASWFVIYALHRKNRILFLSFIPKEHYPLLAAVVCSIGISVWVYTSLFVENIFLAGIVSLGEYLLLISIFVWFHPYKVLFLDRIVKR